MESKGNITNFILIALPLTFGCRVIFFSLFLLTYMVTLSGNLLIIFLIWSNHNLHYPMYFFISNFSFLEICFTTSIIPKLLSIMAYGNREISFGGCLTQCYFYFLLGSVELLFLAVMSFDRYMAICYPLRYTTIMNYRLCLQLVLISWVVGFGDTIVQTVLVSKLPFCGSNVIDHFYCDIDPLLKLACSDTSLLKLINYCCSSLIVFGSLICIILSYVNVIITILKITKMGEQGKSFSTCASHLILVFIVYGSSLFLCLRGTNVSFMNLSKLSAILTGIVTPLLNPFIYTLRNHQVKEVLKQLIAQWTMPT